MARKMSAKSSRNAKRKKGSGGEVSARHCARQFLGTLQPVPEQQEPVGADIDHIQFEDDDEEPPAEEEDIVNDDDVMVADDDEAIPKTVWDPRLHKLEDGEELAFDSSAYTVYHSLRVEWPCLTFDVVRDRLGAVRVRPPYALTLAAGTQASLADGNKVCIWRVTNLCATKYDDASSSEDEEDEDMDGDQPVIIDRAFAHPGGVNRLRSCPQSSNIMATFSENGKVYIWDAAGYIESLEQVPKQPPASTMPPLFEFSGHRDQGFAIDWSPVVPGRFASGDCYRSIHVWQPREATWDVSASPFKSHSSSVEDLQWSPSEQGVFASCSVDRTIRIWDTRTSNRSMLCVDNAHSTDINVISWNQSVAHLLASGSDDGSFKIWDLRQLQSGRAAGFFQWHEKAVTAIEWHPSQDSVLAVASEDDSCTIWDMSVELDKEEMMANSKGGGADLVGVDIPPQLAFVHRGQSQIKDVRFHPQIPSLLTTTAFDGFNFFKPDNLDAV